MSAPQKVTRLDGHQAAKGTVPLSLPKTITTPIADFLGDEDAADEPDKFLVAQLLPVGVVAFLAGLPKTMKTWLLILIGLCVASGRKLFDKFECEQGDVLLVTEEDTVAQVRRRLWWLARGLGLDPRTLPIRVSALIGFRIDDPAQLALLEAEAKGAKFIGLDALTRMHGVDENSRTEMQAVTLALQGLAARTGATVLTIHHMRKRSAIGGDGERAGQRMRGTGDLHALARAILAADKTDAGIVLTAESNYGEDTEPFTVGFHVEPPFNEQPVPGQRRRAWFEYVGDAKVADNERAETEVLLAFQNAPEPLTCAELRAHVERNVGEVDMARKRLAQNGSITPIRYRAPGKRQASDRWVLTTRCAEFEVAE